jgi:hypothetical protein
VYIRTEPVLNGSLNVTTNPVGVGNKLVTTRPRVGIALLVPLMLGLLVSVAVSNWVPAVSRVTLNTPTPAEIVVLAGNVAAASLDVKWTVPV